MIRARAAALAACAVCLACGESSAPLDARSARIVHGEPSGAEEDGVLLTLARGEDGIDNICTASLVAENLLLTARHCVSYLQEGLFECSVRGELIETTPDAGKLGLHVPADSIEVYGGRTPRAAPLARGVRVLSTLSPVICVNDIAFIVLDRALDLPRVPLRLDRPAELHEAVTLVGYGMDEDQVSIDYRSQPRRRKGSLEIVGVGPDLLEDGVTTVSPRRLIVDGPCGCVGDSGGPLLAANSGAVLGVYSLQEGPSCSDPDVRHHLTHVFPFAALLEEAFAAAGAQPLLEPGSEVGSAGEAGAAGAPAQLGDAGAGGGAAEPAESPAAPDSGCAIAPAADHDLPLWVMLYAALPSRRRARARAWARR